MPNDDLKNINTGVNKINKKLSAHFGRKVKLPSGEAEAEQRSIKELTYDQMIMGSMAAMVWGITNAKEEDKVKNALGKQENIFTIVKDIRDTSKTLQENVITYIGQTSLDKSSNSNNAQNIIEIELKNVDSIEALSDLVNKLSESKGSVFVGVNSIVELLKSLSGTDFKKLSDNAKDNLTDLYDVLTENKDELYNIIDSIQTIVNNNTINTDINALSNIIDTIIKVLNIDPKTINTRGLKLLLRLTNSKNGKIKQLLTNLKEITKDIEIKKNVFNEVQNFFESLTALGDIGFAKRRRINNNIKFFKKHIIGMIPDIVKELERTANENQKNATTAIGNLTALFKGITEISDLDIKHKIRLIFNLHFLKRTYLKTILSILEETQKIANSESDKTSKALDSLMNVFKEVLSFGDISFFRIMLVSTKTDMISDVVKNNIATLLQEIVNIQNIKNAYRNIENIHNIIDNINEIWDVTPSLISSLKESINLLGLYGNILLLNEIIEYINDATKISRTASSLYKTSIPNLIKSIFNIFGEEQHELANTQINNLATDIIDFNNNVIKNLGTLIIAINSIPKLNQQQTWVEALKEILKEFDNSTKNTIGFIIQFGLGDKDDYKRFLTLGVALKKFADIIAKFPSIDEDITNNVNNLLNTIKPIAKEFDESRRDSIGKYLTNISDANIEKLDTLISLIKKLATITEIKAVMKLSETSLDAIANLAEPLKLFIKKLASIKDKDVQKAKDIVNTYLKVVICGAAILLLAGVIMAIADIGSLALFTLTLGAFLFALSGIFWALSKTFTKDLTGVNNAMKLVAYSAAILLAGSIVMKIIDPKDLFNFTLALSGFLLGLSIALMIIGKGVSKALEISQDAALLIVACGAMLLFGGIVMKLINYADLIMFGVTLAAFLFGISIPLLIFGLIENDVLDAAYGAATLVGVSGLILLLGGLLMHFIDPAQLILFTVTLGLFILGISLIFLIFNKINKEVFEGMRNVALLIAVSALILLVGAYFIMDIKMVLGAILFTVLLAFFIGAITKTYSWAAKELKTALSTAIALLAVTFLSAVILMIGAYILMKNPDLGWYALAFTAILSIYLVAIIGILKWISKEQKSLWGGIAAMAAIVVITYFMSLVFKEVIKTSKLVDDWFALSATIIIMGGTIMLLAGIAIGIGLAMEGSLGLLAAGIAALAAIIGCIWLMGEAVSAIAEAMGDLAKVSKMDLDFWNLVKLLTGFMLLVGPMMQLGGLLPIILVGSISMLALRSFLSDAATIIQEWAELKIPIYGADGNISGYRVLTDEDKQNAVTNIKDVIMILFSTIDELYDTYPSMFDISLTSLFSGGSKLTKVAIAGKALSYMLSSIANAVKDWADLKIPIYKGKDIAGYKTIDNGDFVKAAENIKQVIITLGQAVIETYKNAPDGMFNSDEWLGFGDSPFAKVCKAMKTMGPMLSSIAEGVQTWADLKIPVYSGTKIVRYDTLNKTKFNQAAQNIKEVIITLGQAVIDTYNYAESKPATKGMFNDGDWLGFGDSTFAKVVKAMNTMGPMLSTMADSIQKWADLKIPVYGGVDKHGNPIIKEYKSLNDGDFKTAADNIKKVLVCIGQALVETVEENPFIFLGDTLLTDSPAMVAANAMKVMGETLNLTATAVASYASGKFPVFDGEGKYVKDLEVDLSKPKVFEDAGDNIKTVLTCIGTALVDTIKDPKLKYLFNEGSDAPAIIAAESIKGMSEALNNSVTAISKLAELELDDLHAALDPNGTDNIYTKLNDLLKFTVDIYKLFASDSSDTAIKGTTRSHWYGDEKNVNMSFAEYLNEHNSEIEDAGEALETFTSILKENIIDKFVEIGKTFIDNTDALNSFNGGLKSPIYTYLNTCLRTISGITQLLTTENQKILYENLDDNKKDIKNGIDDAFSIIDNLLQHLVTSQKLYKQITDFDLSSLSPIIQSFNECVRQLHTIGVFMNDDGSMIGMEITDIESKSLNEKIQNYSNALKGIIDIAKYSEETGEEGYNVLRDGIIKIYLSTLSIVNTGNFAKHVKDLKEYVKSINSIRLGNLIYLNKFVQSMNELSQRLGNLDKLTDAIANKLSAVLYELVLQLRKAEATIDNAHELQEKRKKLIDESISKVKDIMGQHMIVEISQITDDENNENTNSNTPNNTGKINNNSVSEDEGDGTKPPTSTTGGGLPSAEGKKVLTGGDARQLKNTDLTEERFVKLMKDHLRNGSWAD